MGHLDPMYIQKTSSQTKSNPLSGDWGTTKVACVFRKDIELPPREKPLERTRSGFFFCQIKAPRYEGLRCAQHIVRA